MDGDFLVLSSYPKTTYGIICDFWFQVYSSDLRPEVSWAKFV